MARLGEAHRLRFERSGADVDIDAAVDLLTKATESAWASASGHCGILGRLTTTYATRLHATGRGVRREVIDHLADRARQSAPEAPSDRISAMGAVARLAQYVGEHDLAAASFRDAVETLPQLVRWELAWSDGARRLGDFGVMIGEAVTAHLEIGDVREAVKIAEAGRGVLLSARFDLATGLGELRRVRPNLAERFDRLREAHDTGADMPAKAANDIRVNRGWLQDKTFRNVLADIRKVKGFEAFLAAPGWPELGQAGKGRAVVLVNTSRNRSDAILIQDGEPVVVELNRLAYSDVLCHAGNLMRTAPESLHRVVPEILTWLGSSLVEPVLDELGSVQRVWWVPTGLLAVLPLHAAGSALDHVVSSYAPTVRTLLRTSRRSARERRQLAVAVLHTPGMDDLPGALAEIPPGEHLVNDDATREQVLTAMRKANWVHFACHAGGDSIGAQLYLPDGPLPLVDIARSGLRDAELAYLSACSTARPGWTNTNEAIHLASAFQLAGFRHVIGALWPLVDSIGAHAAQRFYDLVTDADSSATALHQVTRELRKTYPNSPEVWASLIHHGP